MSCVNYTPFATLTDAELIREVCCKKDPTDMELELMHRLEYWMEHSETLLTEIDERLAGGMNGANARRKG